MTEVAFSIEVDQEFAVTLEIESKWHGTPATGFILDAATCTGGTVWVNPKSGDGFTCDHGRDVVEYLRCAYSSDQETIVRHNGRRTTIHDAIEQAYESDLLLQSATMADREIDLKGGRGEKR
jgi:hypothetical protein